MRRDSWRINAAKRSHNETNRAHEGTIRSAAAFIDASIAPVNAFKVRIANEDRTMVERKNNLIGRGGEHGRL